MLGIPSIKAYYSDQSNPFGACQQERAANRSKIRNGTMSFRIYNLPNRNICAGRVAHPIPGQTVQAVGWVPCSSPDALTVKLVNQSPQYAAGDYVGCFKDFDSTATEPKLAVAIPVLLHSSLTMNGQQHNQCRQLAIAGGYTVYAVRYNNRCYAGKDFGHALRHGSTGNCPTENVNSYSCCISCGTGCWSGTHRSNAVYTVNAVKSPYPPPLQYQIFGTLGNSKILGNSAPFSGIMMNSLPYMTNTHSWSRLEVEGTGEVIVAAVYRATQSNGLLDYGQNPGAHPWKSVSVGKSDGKF